MLLGLLNPAPALGGGAASGIVPFFRPLIPAAPLLPTPLAPAVPVLGKTGPGLALLFSFAAGYAAGTWLWNLLNKRQTQPGGPVVGEVIDFGKTELIQFSGVIVEDGGYFVGCNGEPPYKGADRTKYKGGTAAGAKFESLKQSAVNKYACGPQSSPAASLAGWRVLRADGSVALNGTETVYDGTSFRGNYRTSADRKWTATLGSMEVGGKPYVFPPKVDPGYVPEPLPEVKPRPLPVVPPLPLPQPGPQPQPQPDPEPVLPQPAAPPKPGDPPKVAPPMAPPITPDRPQPPKPQNPDLFPPLQPDGTPKPEKPKDPETRPPGEETTPEGIVGLPGQAPRPDLAGIAQELGKVEQKLLQLQRKPDPTVDLGPVIDLLMRLLGLIDEPYGGGQFELYPVCETGGDGQPKPPLIVQWPGGIGQINQIQSMVEALAVLHQYGKELRQPVCKTKPIGEEVTVRFLEVP